MADGQSGHIEDYSSRAHAGYGQRPAVGGASLQVITLDSALSTAYCKNRDLFHCLMVRRELRYKWRQLYERFPPEFLNEPSFFGHGPSKRMHALPRDVVEAFLNEWLRWAEQRVVQRGQDIFAGRTPVPPEGYNSSMEATAGTESDYENDFTF